MSVHDRLTLADWRRRVAELYATVRASSDVIAAWHLWRTTRDDLFREHPQSPLPPAQRDGFPGVTYFGYDPAMRVTAEVEDANPERFEIPTSDEGTMTFDRVGTASFELGGGSHQLGMYWLDSYGGGLFVPIRDATCGTETYGAGRYLLDTVKGADLGMQDGKLILDFNFAYNPSCSYDSRWVCPLAPPANRLSTEVRAGERTDND